MEKTTVYLTSQQKAALAAAAREEGRSEARLIRDGIDHVLAGHRTAEAVASPAERRPGDLGDQGRQLERPTWLGRDQFLTLVGPSQADPGLEAELRTLAPDLTDNAALDG